MVVTDEWDNLIQTTVALGVLFTVLISLPFPTDV